MGLLYIAPMRELLQQCLNAGEVTALFPLLSNWSKDDLHLLMNEVDDLGKNLIQMIDEQWKEASMKPENFFNREAAKAIDEARDDAKWSIFSTCSEIASVAVFYLERKYGETFPIN